MLCCVPVVFDSGRCNLPHGHQFSTAPSRGRKRAELTPTQVLLSYSWLVLPPSSSQVLCLTSEQHNQLFPTSSVLCSLFGLLFQGQCQIHFRLINLILFSQSALNASMLNHNHIIIILIISVNMLSVCLVFHPDVSSLFCSLSHFSSSSSLLFRKSNLG